MKSLFVAIQYGAMVFRFVNFAVDAVQLLASVDWPPTFWRCISCAMFGSDGMLSGLCKFYLACKISSIFLGIQEYPRNIQGISKEYSEIFRFFSYFFNKFVLFQNSCSGFSFLY